MGGINRLPVLLLSLDTDDGMRVGVVDIGEAISWLVPFFDFAGVGFGIDDDLVWPLVMFVFLSALVLPGGFQGGFMYGGG